MGLGLGLGFGDRVSNLSPLGVQLEALGIATAEERPALVRVEQALGGQP